MRFVFLASILFLLSCDEKQNRVSAGFNKKVFDQPLNHFEDAWYKRDSLKVLNHIDSLQLLPDSNFIYEMYRFSQVSGFGIALIDITNSSYFSKSDRNLIMKDNLLRLIQAYSTSKYFIKEPCETIMFHEAYDIFDPKLKESNFNKIIDTCFNQINCFVKWEY